MGKAAMRLPRSTLLVLCVFAALVTGKRRGPEEDYSSDTNAEAEGADSDHDTAAHAHEETHALHETMREFRSALSQCAETCQSDSSFLETVLKRKTGKKGKKVAKGLKWGMQTKVCPNQLQAFDNAASAEFSSRKFFERVVKANAIFVPGQERSIDNVVQFIRGATPADDNLKVFSNNDKPVAILLYGPTGSLRTDTVQKLLPKICETGEGTRCPDVYFNIDGHMARMTSETWGGTKSNDKNGLLQLAQKCGLTGFSDMLGHNPFIKHIHGFKALLGAARKSKHPRADFARLSKGIKLKMKDKLIKAKANIIWPMPLNGMYGVHAIAKFLKRQGYVVQVAGTYADQAMCDKNAMKTAKESGERYETSGWFTSMKNMVQTMKWWSDYYMEDGDKMYMVNNGERTFVDEASGKEAMCPARLLEIIKDLRGRTDQLQAKLTGGEGDGYKGGVARIRLQNRDAKYNPLGNHQEGCKVGPQWLSTFAVANGEPLESDFWSVPKYEVNTRVIEKKQAASGFKHIGSEEERYMVDDASWQLPSDDPQVEEAEDDARGGPSKDPDTMTDPKDKTEDEELTAQISTSKVDIARNRALAAAAEAKGKASIPGDAPTKSLAQAVPSAIPKDAIANKIHNVGGAPGSTESLDEKKDKDKAAHSERKAKLDSDEKAEDAKNPATAATGGDQNGEAGNVDGSASNAAGSTEAESEAAQNAEAAKEAAEDESGPKDADAGEAPKDADEGPKDADAEGADAEAHDHEGHGHGSHDHESHDHKAEEGEGHDHAEAEEGESHDHKAEEGESHDHKAEEGESHDHKAEEGESHDHKAEEGESHDHKAEEAEEEAFKAEEGAASEEGGKSSQSSDDPLSSATPTASASGADPEHEQNTPEQEKSEESASAEEPGPGVAAKLENVPMESRH